MFTDVHKTIPFFGKVTETVSFTHSAECVSNTVPDSQDVSFIVLLWHDVTVSWDLQDRYLPSFAPEHDTKHSSVR